MAALFWSYSDGTVQTEDGTCVHLSDVLAFFTAADHDPVFGFPKRPRLMFIAETLATANTCSLILRLPMHRSYAEFRPKMITSIMGHGGFGRPWTHELNSGTSPVTAIFFSMCLVSCYIYISLYNTSDWMGWGERQDTFLYCRRTSGQNTFNKTSGQYLRPVDTVHWS